MFRSIFGSRQLQMSYRELLKFSKVKVLLKEVTEANIYRKWKELKLLI